jgi:farnesyl-diphosphate farnesyltransferase
MKDLYEPAALQRATWAQSGMVLDALRHACDALDYLRILKNQSVFNFCAIPATMAIATLELCFMNPAMFQRNIKIRKATAASVRVFSTSLLITPQLIMRSVNPKEVGLIFRTYARKIHGKAVIADPNFLRISIACGKVCLPSLLPSSFLLSLFFPSPPFFLLHHLTNPPSFPPSQIEQWLEHNYPAFVYISSQTGDTNVTLDPRGPRTRIATLKKPFDAQLAKKKRAEDLRNDLGERNDLAAGVEREVGETSFVEVVAYVMAAFGCLGSRGGKAGWRFGSRVGGSIVV